MRGAKNGKIGKLDEPLDIRYDLINAIEEEEKEA
jgi:hypothetical protein